MRRILLFLTMLIAAKAPLCAENLFHRNHTTSPLDQFIQQAAGVGATGTASVPGSLFRQGGRYSDLARDLRASQVNDVVTILVYDKASAVARGSSSNKRTSSAKAGINSLLGVRPSPGPLTDLAKFGGETQFQGEGETSRQTTLTTSLTGRVTHLLPNGSMVIEGVKDVLINSERQTVTVRGIARPHDLSRSNEVLSDRLAMLEVKVNGKGVVGDAIRRPFILYRLLLGLLPF